MTDQPHMFTTQDMLQIFTTHVQGGSDEDFYIWLTAHDESIREEEREDIAAAEQRGAERGWDEAMTTQIQRLISSDPDVERFHMPANPYRADRLEGDDE